MAKIDGTLEYVIKKETAERKKKVKKTYTYTDGRTELYDSWDYEEYQYDKAVWRITGPLPAIMTSRIVPDAWSGQAGVVEVNDNPANIEHLNWVMMRFRLEIKTPEIWAERKAQLEKRIEKREQLETLQRIAVSAAFRGQLFDYQKEGVDFMKKTDGNCLLADEMGLGKAQPLDAKLLTPKGWIKMGDVKLGDRVIGSDGTDYHVIGIYPQGEKEVFKVTFTDGSSTECTDEHLWQVITPLRKNRGCKPQVKTLYEIRKCLSHVNGNLQHFIPIVKPVLFDYEELQVGPYLLGLLIGDGGLSIKSRVRFSTVDNELLENVKTTVSNHGLLLEQRGRPCDYLFMKKPCHAHYPNWLTTELRKLGLMGLKSANKFIPDVYKLAAFDDRIALLQGLMDTDGYVTKNSDALQFSTSSKQLAEDVKFLVQSLGGIAKTHTKIPQYTYKGEKKQGQLHYILTLSLPPYIQPFRLKRKLERYKPKTKYLPTRAIRSIEPVGKKLTQCIRVDAPDHLYVTDDMIVTHNTVQTIAYLADEGELALPAIVVAPVVALKNWKKHIIKFMQVKRREDPLDVTAGEFAEPRIYVIEDGKPGQLPPADFYIVNYEKLTKRKEDLVAISPKTMVFDEIHYLRHSRSLKYQAAEEIVNCGTIAHRLGLSGTPIYNRGIEMYDIVNIIAPGLLGDYQEFVKIWTGYDEETIKEEKRDALSQLLRQNVMLRRLKADVLKDLPQKTTHRQQISVNMDFYEGEMTKAAERLKEKLENASDNTDLRGISEAYDQFAEEERQIAGIAKVPWVADFVEKMLSINEPVVVFAYHHAVVDLLKERFSSYNPVFITGRQTPKQKWAAEEAFQTGRTNLIICSLRSGNVAIDLFRAQIVVHAEFDWSPSIHKQAEDRLHRIGQTKPVFSYYLEGEGTFDKVIANVLVEKKMEIDSVLGDAQIDTDAQLSKEEIAKQMISMFNHRLAENGRVGVDITMPDKDKIRKEKEELERMAKALAKERLLKKHENEGLPAGAAENDSSAIASNDEDLEEDIQPESAEAMPETEKEEEEFEEKEAIVSVHPRIEADTATNTLEQWFQS